MVKEYLIFLICAVWLVDSSSGDDKLMCPKYCNCDLYENYNRADCSNRKLISSIIDIPITAEILDLSYNDINFLEDKSFKDLKYLMNLTISNNGIHTIYLDAFYDLLELQFIDLSYNRLEYFDPRIFENNRKLLGVNLDGNKFMSLPNEPFIINPSLQFLSLHKAQIMQTTDSQFTKMPLLSKLDLSDNLMITLKVATFIRLGQLKYLNVLNNRWTTCHNDLKSTVEYLRAKQVEVRINVCSKKFGEKKFEKMMMAPVEEDIETNAKSDTEKDISLVWKNSTILNLTNNLKCDVENLDTICTLYESCNIKYNKLLSDQAIIHYRSNWIDHNDRVYVALYSGLFLGFFVTSSVVYVIYLICGSRYWKKRRLQRKLAQRRRQTPPCQSSRDHQIIVTRPVRLVRCPPRPPQPQPTRHAINRAHQREFLLARLFERPERHRYIHRHSSLNNRARTATNSENLDTERLIRPSPTEDDTVSPIALAAQEPSIAAIPILQNEPMIENLADITVTTANGAEHEELDTHTTTIARAETPPPPYSEIVKD